MPVRRVLVQLSKLPVHRVYVHVVVLLKVLRQQLDRVITSMQTSLALKDFLHLYNTTAKFSKLTYRQRGSFVVLRRCYTTELLIDRLMETEIMPVVSSFTSIYWLFLCILLENAVLG